MMGKKTAQKEWTMSWQKRWIVMHLIHKQVIDEELINAVQKIPLLYDYRMPLKERSRQKIDL